MGRGNKTCGLTPLSPESGGEGVSGGVVSGVSGITDGAGVLGAGSGVTGAAGAGVTAGAGIGAGALGVATGWR